MSNTLDRTQQLERLRERYARRNKPGRSRMLDELCEQYGYDRKHAIKLLGDALPASKGTASPGPLPRYAAIREAEATIWEHAEQLCGFLRSDQVATGQCPLCHGPHDNAFIRSSG